MEKNTFLIKDKIFIRGSRFYYFDYLRIFCSFFVILIHVSAKYKRLEVNSYKMKIAYYYDGLSRFSVPNFFMISGALFLSKNLSFQIIIEKYIKRIFIHLLLWSMIYSFTNGNISKLGLKKGIIQIIKGPFHLWYLLAIIGLYIIVPFAREIIKNKTLLFYLLLFNFIFVFFLKANISA